MKAINVLLAVLMVLCAVSCKKENAVKWIVDTKDGLRMRETPDTNGKVLALIPDKSEVKFVSEKSENVTVGNVTGKWTEIEWNGQKGWVFGGFLKKVDPGVVEAPKAFDGNYPRAANGWHLLNNIPKNWERLFGTDGDGKPHTLNPCMGAPDTISITTDESGPTISFNGGTDGVTCRKVSIRQHEGALVFTLDQCGSGAGDMEGQKEMAFQFVPGGPDGDIYSDNECASWDGDFFGGQSQIYVPAQNKGKFENVSENCGQ